MVLVTAPSGPVGSARARYAAAMALYQSGQLSAEVLEVYRGCVPLDADNPLDVLRIKRVGADWIARATAFGATSEKGRTPGGGDLPVPGSG